MHAADCALRFITFAADATLMPPLRYAATPLLPEISSFFDVAAAAPRRRRYAGCRL